VSVSLGARPLKRALQRRIENPVAKLILEGKFGPKDVIPVGLVVDLSLGKIIVRSSDRGISETTRNSRPCRL
jgi:ATP-dependent Clp protease ATP-binding subunit ClpA